MATLVKYVARLWYELSHEGAVGLDYAQARRVILVNQFCLIAIALNLVYALQVLLLDAASLIVFVWLTLLACLAFMAAMRLNASGRQYWAKRLLASIPVATLVFSAYLAGNGAGLQLYLIVIWTLLFLIFTRAELPTLLFFSLAYWLAFMLIQYTFTTPALDYDFPPGLMERIYGLSVTGTFLAVALVVGLFFTEIHRAEQRLQAEHERSERLLRNILPGPIAERLKQRDSDTDQAAIADGYDEATVLFADLVGFTPLSAIMSPQELVALLNRIFSGFDEIAMAQGLEKIKTLGDAYMLVGGVPQPQPDHAAAAAEAALQMLNRLPLLSGTGAPLELRIGIHCGPLVAGVIGRHKFAYDVWGDTVNIASRMESHGVPGRIQVSAALHQKLRDRYRFDPRGKIDIKGLGPTPTWFLLRHDG